MPVVLTLVRVNQGFSLSQHQPLPLSVQSPAASVVLASVTEEEITRVMTDFPSKKSDDCV